jgi:hypothetical protein
LISERDLTAAEFVALCRDDAEWRRASERASVQTATLAGADHTFSTRAALEEATARCVSWLEAALPVPAAEHAVRRRAGSEA